MGQKGHAYGSVGQCIWGQGSCLWGRPNPRKVNLYGVG